MTKYSQFEICLSCNGGDANIELVSSIIFSKPKIVFLFCALQTQGKHKHNNPFRKYLFWAKLILDIMITKNYSLKKLIFKYMQIDFQRKYIRNNIHLNV